MEYLAVKVASNQIPAKLQPKSRWIHQLISKRSKPFWAWSATWVHFISNLSSLTVPLRKLLIEKAPFCFNATFREARDKIKDSIIGDQWFTSLDQERHVIRIS